MLGGMVSIPSKERLHPFQEKWGQQVQCCKLVLSPTWLLRNAPQQAGLGKTAWDEVAGSK